LFYAVAAYFPTDLCSGIDLSQKLPFYILISQVSCISCPTSDMTSGVEGRGDEFTSSDRVCAVSRKGKDLKMPKSLGGLSMPTHAHLFEGQKSKVKVTRPTNAESGIVSYLPNWKAC